MKTLYTQKEFNSSNSTDKLPCKCYFCNKTFYIKKGYIKHEIKSNKGEVKYCSKTCKTEDRKTIQTINCTNCNKQFEKLPNQIKKSKNHFCSHSCNASYNNKHKSHGTRRSKIEVWLEEQLIQLYPNLPIDFNKKSAIDSELDIYIPSLNIAIELNGIFHYEPIYGVDKLNKIQENDISKSKACHDAKIDLCTIDTSGQKYFKESTSKKYIDIINNIIKERLSIS